MSYTNFQVGEKFPLPIKAQGDGGIFQYDINGAMFILKLSKTDVIAAEAFRTGKTELALFVEDNIIFLLYKIDGIFKGWGDCPYSVQFLTKEQRPDFSKQQEKVMNLYLVDSRLDVLLSMRTIKLNDDFHQQLITLTKDQLNEPFETEAYTAKVQTIWNKYTPEEMYNLAVARQEIGLDISVKPAGLPQ